MAKTQKDEWYIDQVAAEIHSQMKKRVMVATEFLKSRVVRNISKSVGRSFKDGKAVVTERSVPGEYPRADTTMLMKTIIGEVEETSDGKLVGFVGTPLDYGVTLELHKNRSFLLRTYNENRSKIAKILTKPI